MVNEERVRSFKRSDRPTLVAEINDFLTLKMAKIKIVDQFDSRFSLEPEAQATLFRLLTSDAFRQQVSQQVECDEVEFTEKLFQPVPYSLKATKGMPVEYEQYHQSPEYAIINVPPNFMFTAKIFQPSRLCAIYRKITR